MILTPQLKEHLESQHYFNIVEIPGKGICALHTFVFTTGLVYGINEIMYEGRYCYGSPEEAAIALKHWNGEGYPPGLWIKHKGDGVEESNPLNQK